MRKGNILGKGYLLKEQEYVVGIGAANVDVHGRSKAPINLRDSNPGHMNVSAGGVTKCLRQFVPAGGRRSS